MVNGADAQHSGTLQFAHNVGGVGDLTSDPATGGHKMAHAVFEAFSFKELLVVTTNSDGSAEGHATLSKNSGLAFTASEAFGWDALPYITIVAGGTYGGMSSTSTTSDAGYAVGSGTNHGPFFWDPFNRQGCGWMWRNTGDPGKGRLANGCGCAGNLCAVRWA